MYDKIIFQKNPIKFENKTLKCIGMYQKLIVVAIGHIIQLHCNVSQILTFLTFNPSFNPWTEKDSVKLFTTKNPERRMGIKSSWSIATKIPTFRNLDVELENNLDEMSGTSLLCHKCSIGAVYDNPTVPKLRFLLRSNESF